jgi:SAM-dependent methyltransferase
VQRVPERETERPAGMVHYLPSSVRTTLALARLLAPDDVFFDVGSGLGLVTLLVAWVSGARAVGLEYEPTYHRMAVERATQLGIPRVRFELGDARAADLSEGTVFYVYDTFRGAILDDMIARLEAEAARRPIRVISRGHSTPTFDATAWLERTGGGAEGFVVYRARG